MTIDNLIKGIVSFKIDTIARFQAMVCRTMSHRATPHTPVLKAASATKIIIGESGSAAHHENSQTSSLFSSIDEVLQAAVSYEYYPI